MPLRKLFIVGLGTTGTDVCERLAKRLENEFGELDRVPWVQFFCLETDAAKPGLMSERGCLLPLTIGKDDYKDLLADTTALDEALDFSNNWDIQTLKKITDISAGVGNVRMAGRLAFFYPQNFVNIENHLPEAINALAELSPLDAKKQRGALPGGANPPIQFLGDGGGGAKSTVVVVVGTLCGGTGSGLCVDLGYYLRDKCPNTHVMSIFTLPRPDLATAKKEDAERLKANAYTALQELHHYSQAGEVEYTAKYSGQTQEIRSTDQPYELALLAWPPPSKNASPGRAIVTSEEATPVKEPSDGEKELGDAIAERLFLMSFDGTDPFATMVNVQGLYQSAGQATHTIFGSLGLSTLEHPGPRLTEGCARRLLAYTFGAEESTNKTTWATRTLPAGQVGTEVQAMGISWEQIRQDADTHVGGLEQRLIDKAKQALKALGKDPAAYRKMLDQLALAFAEGESGQNQDPSLPTGIVLRSLQSAQAAIADSLVQRVHGWLGQRLMRWDTGPGACLEALDEAIARITAMEAQEAPLAVNNADLRRAADQLEGLRADHLVGAMFLYPRAAADVVANLQAPLRAHVAQRYDAAVRRVLTSGKDRQGLPSHGTLELARRTLERTRKRVSNLKQGVAAYAVFCQDQATTLARVPAINGQIMMHEGQADREYRLALAGQGDDQAFAAAQERAAVALLATWEGVPAAVTATTQTFYDTPPPTGDLRTTGAQALPHPDRLALLGAARTRFGDLLRDDVIVRWAAEPNAPAVAQQLVRDAKPLISPNLARAQQLLGRPPAHQSLAIYPGQGTGRHDVQRFSQSLGVGLSHRATDSAFRAIVLNEYYDLPLEAVPGIVRTPGTTHSLEGAKFTGWMTASRLNTGGWIPISPEERARLAKCRRLLAVSIVLGLLPVSAQRLKLTGYSAGGFEGDNFRELPNNFDQAARQWALSGRDCEGRDLAGMEGLLAGRIAGLRQPQAQGAAGFVNLLEQKLGSAGNGIADWNRGTVARLIGGYCRGDGQLRPAFYRKYGPSPDIQNLMFYQAGQTTVAGPCPQTGFCCLNADIRCDGYLGLDVAAAADGAWQCPICLTEYHSVGPTYNPDWITTAGEAKAGGTVAQETQSLENWQPTAAPGAFQG